MSARTPDREQRLREQLADAIMRRHRDIEARWLERIRKAIHRDDVTSTELRNSMPEYLMRLSEELRRSSNAEASGMSSWENVARKHAEERVRLGFDIDQLVDDFIVLRQVLFSVLIEEEGLHVDVDQFARVSDMIEGAIAAAVKSYACARDYQLRRQESEHIGFITHELRNPLTTATLGTNQLRRSVASSLSAEQTKILAAVERSHRRLAELIDGVLLVERDAHAQKPHLAVTTLGQVFAEPVAAAKLAAEAKGLHVKTRFDPEVVVEIDPKLTRSAIDNVVQNAVKFTDAGDIDVVAEESRNEIVVHIRDSGPGIPKEALRNIFEPFVRARSTKPGSGLGLAIARRAVELQGGTIHVESTGRGCHFWLTLPKPRG